MKLLDCGCSVGSNGCKIGMECCQGDCVSGRRTAEILYHQKSFLVCHYFLSSIYVVSVTYSALCTSKLQSTYVPYSSIFFFYLNFLVTSTFLACQSSQPAEISGYEFFPWVTSSNSAELNLNILSRYQNRAPHMDHNEPLQPWNHYMTIKEQQH